jgi:DDE domain
MEVVTDLAPVYPATLEELLPAAWHRTDRYGNNRLEADHGRLKARLRPMRGLKQDRSARVVIAGHGFVENLRRGRYELAVEEPVARRLAVAFDELPWRSDPSAGNGFGMHPSTRCNSASRTCGEASSVMRMELRTAGGRLGGGEVVCDCRWRTCMDVQGWNRAAALWNDSRSVQGASR